MDIKQYKVKVSIRCTVYNHEKYLRQCLDGIVSQETDFLFEAIVHDDASTDGSAKIIKEYSQRYPNIIKPIYQTENQYSKDFTIIRRAITEKCTGEYMAWCEGDDYWIDPKKLQKQVDILDKTPNVGLVFGRAKQYVEKVGVFKKESFGSCVKDAKSLLMSNTIPTPTVLLRTDIYMKYMAEAAFHRQNWLMGDYPMWIYFALNTDLHFIDEDLAVYRILEESACHSKDRAKLERFYNSAIAMKSFFNERYNLVPKSVIEDQENELFLLNAAFFCDREEVIHRYFKLKSPQIISTIFYLLAKFHLLRLYALYKRVFA